MELHTALVLSQPVVVLLVRAVVVQDHMDFFVHRALQHHAVEESAKIFPLLLRRGLCIDMPAGHFQGRKEVQSTMAFVGALQGPHQGSVATLPRNDNDRKS